MLFAWILCSTATAAAGKRVAVYVDAPAGHELSAELVAALPPGFTIIDASELKRALAERHAKRVAAAFGSAKRRHELPDKLRQAAVAIGADAVVLAGQSAGEPELHLMVLVSARSSVAVDARVPLSDEPKRKARFRNLLAGALSELIDSEASAQAAGEDQPDPPKKPKHEPASTGPARRSFADALLAGFVGLDFGGRQLHYRDRVTNANLRPYDLPQGLLLPVAPGVAASVELFPFAGTDWGVARDLGVSSHVSYDFASSRIGDVTAKTKWFGWELDLRGRLLLEQRRALPLLGFELGLGRQAFLFSAPGPTQDVLPSVDYYYVRIGADGRIPLGPVDLVVGAAYRHLESRRGPSGATVPAAGRFGEHFPHAQIAGLDAKLGAAVPLSRNIEARLVINYTRYWSELHPAVGDPYIAGGALDQMLNVDLGIAACF